MALNVQQQFQSKLDRKKAKIKSLKMQLSQKNA
jgi:hypothetical protein